jgi:uncharacterized membrane protein YccC
MRAPAFAPQHRGAAVVFSKEGLYAVKTFAAAMVALWLAFAADLDRPYWAMASAFIASQPNDGATRSKALYRMMGTLLGASAAVALVPNLANAPELLVAAMAAWIATMLTLALLDRTPRSYAFMLAGYTAAIIGFPSVETPGDIFTVALARAEEIGLGVVCATVVSALVFPVHVRPLILARMESWLREGETAAARALRDEPLPLDCEPDRKRLAADVVDIGVLTAQLPFDRAGPPVSQAAVRALHARLLMLLPLCSSVASRLAALRAAGASLSEPRRQRMARLLEGGAAPEFETARPTTDWRGVLEESLRLRLVDLATLLRDARTLLQWLRDNRPGLPPLEGGLEVEAAPLQHRDPLMAIYSGAAAAVTIGLICAYWIASAWPEGAVAAELAAVACSFFAAQDDPAPAIFRFLRGTVVAVIVDGVYLFAVLPAIDGFPLLVVALAPTFLFYGWLTARPATASIGMALSANGATLLALQSTYSADFASFANSGVAAVIGMSAAAVVTRLLRSVAADWSAWRLVRANWVTLAAAAAGRGAGDRTALAGLIADRIGLIASRSGVVSAEQAPNMSKLQADLRIGLNIVALRRARRQASPEVAEVLEAVLDALASYYRRLARGPLGRPKRGPDPGGLARIDAAIARVCALTAGPDALQGLVGVRLGLYPDAPPFGDAPEPLEQKAAA